MSWLFISHFVSSEGLSAAKQLYPDHNSIEFFSLSSFSLASGHDHLQQMALVSEALQCSREELEGHNVGIIHDIYIFCDVEQIAQCIYKCTQKAK